MTLSTGTQVGPYEVLALLGAGGMGEVYRARDTKLGRDVALKVLPEAFAKDAQRMGRFQREAQMLASLNHPNIAAIYGLEESGGVRALVMELVEGPTLAEGLALAPPSRRPSEAGKMPALRSGGALPLDEALHIAQQIAEALEAAHEKGIIHRDLKPANIKITHEGTVKVLDFGLAKAVEADSSGSNLLTSPTLTVAATQAGMIMGTAAYMSPEQARGKRADRRADVWGFGVVLFEMLAGQHAFDGETISDTLAAVIKSDPNWDALPGDLPPSIRRLLERCLDKDPKRRLQAIGEARITIEETLSGAPSPPAPLPVGEGGTEGRVRVARRRAASWVAAALLVCLAALGGWWLGGRRVPPPRWSGDLLGGSSVAFGPRISPDGRTLAFQAMVDNLTQVAVMNPDSGNWTVLTRDRSRGLVNEIAWSRDGSKLYFDRIASQPRGIYTVPSLGGDERLILEDAATPVVLPDRSLLVWRIDPDRKQRVYHFWPDSGRLQALGAWLTNSPISALRGFHDGKEAVYYGMAEGAESDGLPHLYVLDVATGKARRLAAQLPIAQLPGGFPLAVTPDDRSVLIDLPAGNLHQIVAIPRSGSGPVRTLMTLTRPPWLMDAGPDGSLYLDQVERPLEVLRFPVSGGTPEVLATSEAYPAGYMQPMEFPDGRFLIQTLLSGRARLLIGKPGGNFFPLIDTPEATGPPAAVLPDNQVAFIAGTGAEQTIAIASARDGRIIRRLQGVKGTFVTSLAASPDGSTLYYTAGENAWAIPAADGTPRKIGAGDGVAVNPNGKDLIVNLLEKERTRLVRIPLSGGPGQEIHVQSDLPIVPIPIGGNAIRKDGKILIGVNPLDSWFFRLSLLDPASGRLSDIPLNYVGDIMISGWGNDGRILAFGNRMHSHLWRFRPAP